MNKADLLYLTGIVIFAYVAMWLTGALDGVPVIGRK